MRLAIDRHIRRRRSFFRLCAFLFASRLYRPQYAASVRRNHFLEVEAMPNENGHRRGEYSLGNNKQDRVEAPAHVVHGGGAGVPQHHARALRRCGLRYCRPEVFELGNESVLVVVQN